MTADQWNEVEKSLSGLFGNVKLQIDGYEITLIKKQLDENRLVISVFINGWFKGEMLHDEDLCKRFFCKHDLYLWKAKQKALMKRLKDPSWNAKRTYYLPYFSKFAQLKKTLIRNNKSIEIISE